MSKEEAIEILSDIRCEYNLFGDTEEATRYHCLSWAIKAMSQPERKKGKWYAIGNTGLAQCECGYITDRYSIYNFCPNCGAEMKGDNDD